MLAPHYYSSIKAENPERHDENLGIFCEDSNWWYIYLPEGRLEIPPPAAYKWFRSHVLSVFWLENKLWDTVISSQGTLPSAN